jgi:hypothetical protein
MSGLLFLLALASLFPVKRETKPDSEAQEIASTEIGVTAK